MAGIYIHIPFCKQACHYCNFYFTTSLRQKSALVKAIIAEIALSRDYLAGETIETIYFGGGTPSLLSGDEIKSIIEAIHQSHPSVSLRELTLEANPDDLTPAKVSELVSLKSYGLNRLSIGIQSFHNIDLLYMNRAHTATEAGESIRRVQDAGFRDLTIDLIYGTPTMNDDMWRQNLANTFALGISHVSSYALTVEHKTYLDRDIRKGKVLPVNEADSARQFDILMSEMQSHRYEQYEISNYARDGRYAIHNTNYWLGKKYLGLGPSAHSYDGMSRSWNVSNNMNYIKAIAEGKIPMEIEMLSLSQQTNEYIMTSLRTMWGLNINSIKVESHRSEVMQSLIGIEPAFYTIENHHIKLTQMGRHYADGIASRLFVD
jgi:oxygen-independent coproporphyrinogen-3 oxidase